MDLAYWIHGMISCVSSLIVVLTLQDFLGFPFSDEASHMAHSPIRLANEPRVIHEVQLQEVNGPLFTELRLS